MGGEADLLRAIEYMKSGNPQPAAALLRRAVEDPALDARSRAVACIWLAETQDDMAFKMRCLQQALRLEPNNPQVQQRLAALRALQAQRPLGASAQSSRASLRLRQAPLVLGIDGGINGWGSGILVNRGGLVATSAYVVGSALDLFVAYGNAQPVPGQLLRRYPESDLALIQTALVVNKLGALERTPTVITNEAVTAMAYNGVKISGVAQDAADGARQGWLRTSIMIAMVPDAGGNPLYDSRGHVVGLLTRNVDHNTGCAWAIRLAHIMTLAEQCLQELRLLPASVACGACGCRAQAGHYGGRYCETCGARLPPAVISNARSADTERLAEVYGENQSRPCPRCAAKAGYYIGQCLRCSFELAPAGITT